jgi:hypothetical protein
MSERTPADDTMARQCGISDADAREIAKQKIRQDPDTEMRACMREVRAIMRRSDRLHDALGAVETEAVRDAARELMIALGAAWALACGGNLP